MKTKNKPTLEAIALLDRLHEEDQLDTSQLKSEFTGVDAAIAQLTEWGFAASSGGTLKLKQETLLLPAEDSMMEDPDVEIRQPLNETVEDTIEDITEDITDGAAEEAIVPSVVTHSITQAEAEYLRQESSQAVPYRLRKSVTKLAIADLVTLLQESGRVDLLDQLLEEEVAEKEVTKTNKPKKPKVKDQEPDPKPKPEKKPEKKESKREQLARFMTEAPRTETELIEFSGTAKSAIQATLRAHLPLLGYTIYALGEDGNMHLWYPTGQRAAGVKLAGIPRYQIRACRPATSLGHSQ